jgi:hypothetical protein
MDPAFTLLFQDPGGRSIVEAHPSPRRTCLLHLILDKGQELIAAYYERHYGTNIDIFLLT